MFNMGGGEMVVVSIIAILLIPAKKLPELAISVGKFLAQLQRSFQDVQKDLEKNVKDPLALEVKKRINTDENKSHKHSDDPH